MILFFTLLDYEPYGAGSHSYINFSGKRVRQMCFKCTLNIIFILNTFITIHNILHICCCIMDYEYK